jgi:hypothetical protein
MVEAAASRRLCASKAPILGDAEPAFQLMRPSSPTREGKHLMKSYKLIGWPDLPAPLMRTPYQRMLHQMSHQFVTISALAACSGLSRPAVMQFLEYLLGVGMLKAKEEGGELEPGGHWLQRLGLFRRNQPGA